MYVYMYFQIHKYNLFGLCDVTYKYIVSLGRPPLGKTIHPVLRFTQLPGALWLGLRPYGFCAFPVSIAIGVISSQLLCRQPCGEPSWVWPL